MSLLIRVCSFGDKNTMNSESILHIIKVIVILNFIISSTMFGGTLSKHSLVILEDRDLLITAFGNCLYLFSF